MFWILCSFLASGDFCHLLINFVNSLDPDQEDQNVGPDLDLNRLRLIAFLKEFLKNNGRHQQKHEKLPGMQKIKKTVSV